jgi:hypothetical protein
VKFVVSSSWCVVSGYGKPNQPGYGGQSQGGAPASTGQPSAYGQQGGYGTGDDAGYGGGKEGGYGQRSGSRDQGTLLIMYHSCVLCCKNSS